MIASLFFQIQKRGLMMNTISKETNLSKKKSPIKTVTVSKKQKSNMDAHKRHQMISETAYHLAEKRGFKGQSEMDDWLQAEAEVDAM